MYFPQKLTGLPATLPIMPVITQAMRDIYALAANEACPLLGWWSADTGVHDPGTTNMIWRSRSPGHHVLRPKYGVGPARLLNAHNGRPALVAGDSSPTIGVLHDGDLALQPATGSFSWVWCARLGTVHSYPVGDGGSAYVWHRVSDRRIQANLSAGNAGLSQATPDGVPHYGIFSVDTAGDQAVMRLNGGTVPGLSVSTAATATSTRFQLFDYGPTASLRSQGMWLLEAMLFAGPVHTVSGVTALLESYLSDRFAI